MGWLSASANPDTGMWGSPQPAPRWLQAVNGFYRLTRGSYAQLGLPLPYPEAAIDTVLEHAADPHLATPDGYTACNVLDVDPPALARREADRAPPRRGRGVGARPAAAGAAELVDVAGFAFAPASDGADAVAGLQGTEMWLSIVWLLSDYLGLADDLGYRPRGVHSPDPLVRLAPISER